VTQVVRAERRHACRLAGPSDRRPQLVGADAGEELRLEVAVFSRRNRCLDRLCENVGNLDPQGCAGLRRRRSYAGDAAQVEEISAWRVVLLRAPLLGHAAEGAKVPGCDEEVAVEMPWRDRLVESDDKSSEDFGEVLRE
jgi:hypothetical protein